MKKFLFVLAAAACIAASIAVATWRDGEVAAPEPEPPQPQAVYVYISGAVRKPGLYAFDKTVRVGEVVEAAGNTGAYADVSAVNYAAEAKDGDHIHIPYQLNGEPGESGGDGLVNINEADAETLDTLPGVGPATAEKIVEYRNEHGAFAHIEELQDVKGIGEAKFEQLRHKITV